MLKAQRQNFHHSKLPKPGEIGYIVGLSTVDPTRKCIVSHYPLCDNVLPYSIGIHTVFVRFLDNGEVRRFSGIWFYDDYSSADPVLVSWLKRNGRDVWDRAGTIRSFPKFDL